MKKLPIFIWVVLLISWESVRADYLIVQRPVSLKDKPSTSAATSQSVAAGETLLLLDEGRQQNGYYSVSIPSVRKSGWVYRSFVRRYRGDHAPLEVGRGRNLLADASYEPQAKDLEYAARHLSIGKPQAFYERARAGYVVGFDARLKIPAWVQYELTREELGGEHERSDDFRPDTSIPYGARSELGDYSRSGFDRGHMAPAEDMSWSEETMSESFLLSNMAPQVGVGFNRGIWKNLEAAVRGWVQQRGRLTIITGPAFVDSNGKIQYQIFGKSRVAVPTHFFKVVVDSRDSHRIGALAFLVPNQSNDQHQLEDFLVSIDEVERLTGLDLLGSLAEDTQRALESKKGQLW